MTLTLIQAIREVQANHTGETPLTNAEIAAAINADLRLNKNISVPELRSFLIRKKLLGVGLDKNFNGALITAVQNPEMDGAGREALGQLMTGLQLGEPEIKVATDPESRESALTALNALVTLEVITEAQAAEVLGMAGGYRYPKAVTEAQVATELERDRLSKLLRDSTAVAEAYLADTTEPTEAGAKAAFDGKWGE